MLFAYHHETEPIRVVRRILNVLNTQDTKNVGSRLKSPTESDDPGVRFAMSNCLDDMCDSRCAEQDSE